MQDKAAAAARWLGYLPFDRIVDQRNAEPTIRVFERPYPDPYISVGVDVDIPDVSEITPTIGVSDFYGVQPYKIVMVGEKSSLADVLAPLAHAHEADLYLPTGEMSDALIHRIASTGARDGRPMVVLYFADCDPAGHQMGISVARKLQALRAFGEHRVRAEDAYGNRYLETVDFGGLEFEVHRVALTVDQVREYGLPSTPLKDTEQRADRWRQATGVEQTEVDALASLRPDLLRSIARDAVTRFYDTSLDRRVAEARRQWLTEAQQALDDSMDAEELDRVRTEAADKLAELQSEIDAINDALRVDVDRDDLPEIVIPGPELDGDRPAPLLDSSWEFAEQCHRLIASKAYRDGAP